MKHLVTYAIVILAVAAAIGVVCHLSPFDDSRWLKVIIVFPL
jgi:hypothetical protein